MPHLPEYNFPSPNQAQEFNEELSLLAYLQRLYRKIYLLHAVLVQREREIDRLTATLIAIRPILQSPNVGQAELNQVLRLIEIVISDG